MTEKIREFLQQKRWLQLKKTDWIAVALVGVLLLVVAMPSGGTGIHLAENKKEDTAQEKTEQKYEKEDYAEYLEHKLEQVLGQMEGVGKVSVMVTVPPHVSYPHVLTSEFLPNLPLVKALPDTVLNVSCLR